MIELRVRLILLGLASGLAATQSIAENEERADTEVIEVVEKADLYQGDPAEDFRAAADSVLEALALEQEGKLQESMSNSYGQLVSELEMYDDGRRVVDTAETEQGEGERTRTNFVPSG